MKKDSIIFGTVIIIIAVLLFAVSIPAALDGFIDGNLNVTGTGEFGGDVDMNLNYVLYFPLETSLTHAVGPGVTDVELIAIPPGVHPQDVHFWMFMISLDNPPGDGKTFNASISDGTNTIYCWITGAVDKEASNMTGAFDLDVSVETLTVAYSQTAGGAVTEVHTMRHWWYKENE